MQPMRKTLSAGFKVWVRQAGGPGVKKEGAAAGSATSWLVLKVIYYQSLEMIELALKYNKLG